MNRQLMAMRRPGATVLCLRPIQGRDGSWRWIRHRRVRRRTHSSPCNPVQGGDQRDRRARGGASPSIADSWADPSRFTRLADWLRGALARSSSGKKSSRNQRACRTGPARSKIQAACGDGRIVPQQGVLPAGGGARRARRTTCRPATAKSPRCACAERWATSGKIGAIDAAAPRVMRFRSCVAPWSSRQAGAGSPRNTAAHRRRDRALSVRPAQANAGAVEQRQTSGARRASPRTARRYRSSPR